MGPRARGAWWPGVATLRLGAGGLSTGPEGSYPRADEEKEAEAPAWAAGSRGSERRLPLLPLGRPWMARSSEEEPGIASWLRWAGEAAA